MKKKVDENLMSAQLLINKGYYSASIHCLYYSCFQLAKYILHTFGNLDYESQNTQSHQRESHKFISEKFYTLNNQRSRFLAIDCKNDLQKLKLSRKIADYTDKTISQEIAQEMLAVATKFNDTCKQTYKI